jgi:hypothetical protein
MKHQLHPSGMESLARCGIAYERRYINGERTPPSARMLIGTAVDRSVRANLQRKIDDGTLLPVDEVRDAARDALVEEWAGGVRLSEEDGEDGIASRDRALDMSVGLAGFHHTAVAPALRPTHVARKWVLDIDGLDIQLAGEIDIQEPGCIRDTKTSGKSPTKTLADESLQLSTYALAVRQIDGALPGKVVLDYLVQTPKRAEQKLVQLESTRTDASLRPVLARLEQMSRILESGMFTPAAIGSWWCSRKFCSYHETCKYAAQPVTVAVA